MYRNENDTFHQNVRHDSKHFHKMPVKKLKFIIEYGNIRHNPIVSIIIINEN